MPPLRVKSAGGQACLGRPLIALWGEQRPVDILMDFKVARSVRRRARWLSQSSWQVPCAVHQPFGRKLGSVVAVEDQVNSKRSS